MSMINKFNFTDKVALITGGTKGIGKSITLALAAQGAKIVTSYSKDDQAAEKLNNILKQSGVNKFLILKADVSQKKEALKLIRAAKKNLGHISMLVNNAGILKQGDFFKLTENSWDKTFNVNLKGPFMLCQAAIPLMAEKGSGAIVNIASVGGQIGGNKAPDYAASKAGLISLTKSMARLGSKHGIRVNAVAPGWIETPIFSKNKLAELQQEAKGVIPLGRLGQPDEVAWATVFLLSDAASYITGHCLNVNGGMYFG